MKNNTGILNIIDTVNDIEDGLQALRFIANTDHDEITNEEEFSGAYNYVSDKVFADLKMIRDDLTVFMKNENGHKSDNVID